MRSTNPVLTNNQTFSIPRQGGLPTTEYGGFTTTTRAITMDDIIVRSGILLGTLVVTGALSWVLNVPIGIALVAGLAAFVLAMVATFKRTTSPALFLGYAALEGVVIGAVSHLYESVYSGIVVQAVLGVVMVFATMLTLYRSRVIRVSSRFIRVVAAAGLAFVGLMLVNLVAGFFVDGGLGLRDGGPLAIMFSIAGVVIGAFFYALDFNEAERLVAAGVPEKEAWRVGFGLTLTTVWVYLEVLRLLSYFRN